MMLLLFVLLFIDGLLAFLGQRTAAISLFVLTLLFSLALFCLHITDPLNIQL